MHMKLTDIPLISWLLRKAFLAFLMFEFRELWMILLVIWITVRCPHEAVEVEQESDDRGRRLTKTRIFLF